MIAPERRGANRHRHTTAPARNTSSKAPKTPHYCWYSVRLARPVVRNATRSELIIGGGEENQKG